MTTPANHVSPDQPLSSPAGSPALVAYEDQIDDAVAIAVEVTERLWPHLGSNPVRIQLVARDIARQYQSHRERTPSGRPMDVTAFVDRYVSQVESQLGDLSASPTLLWAEYAARLEPEFTVAEPLPPHVSRRLRCYDHCCVDDPHAEMRLLVSGEEIGGTRFDHNVQWVSWGPAGQSGHQPTRCAAEAVQLAVYSPAKERLEPDAHESRPDSTS